MSEQRSAGLRLVVVGDLLLDRDVDGTAERLAPDAPVPVVADPADRVRPGGAGLAALLAAGPGVAVTLVAAVGDGDAAGCAAVDELRSAGVAVTCLPTHDPVGEKIRISAGGRPLVRVDRGGTHTAPQGTRGLRTALDAADAVLVADYGRGMTADPAVRDELTRAARRVPLVWDPHPRGCPPVPGTRLATPNRAELAGLVDGATGSSDGDATGPSPANDPTAPPAGTGSDLAWLTRAAAALRDAWGAPEICATLGRRGALLVGGDGTPLVVPAPAAGPGADPCGAGDRFASAVALALAGRALPSEAVQAAVAAASAFVAAGGARGHTARSNGSVAANSLGNGLGNGGAEAPADLEAKPGALADTFGPADAAAVVRRVRSAGGVVVATGGCFDLLHAGHVQLLQAARVLGDALVVCLNSEASVARLKGPGRPLTSTADRIAVLSGLACVDAVQVFDEDTPERILAELRPDVWVKGADYAVADLPEAPLVASWGGQAVVLPYLPGRSTTQLLEEARRAER